MTIFRQTVFVFLLATGLTACERLSSIQMGPRDQRDFAEKFIGLFAAHNTTAIENDLDSRIRGRSASAMIQNITAKLPAEAPLNIQEYRWGSMTQSGQTFYSVDLMYHYKSDKDFAADVVLVRFGNGYRVYGIHFQPLPRAAAQANDFHVQGKPAVNYVFAVMMLMAFTFTLYVLANCIRTRHLRRKWLWIVFILLGAGKWSLNWTTGAMAFMPIAFQILSVSGFGSGLFAPWILGVSFPLGAAIFLIKKVSLTTSPEPQITGDGTDGS